MLVHLKLVFSFPLNTFPDNLLERFGVNEPILLEEILSAAPT